VATKPKSTQHAKPNKAPRRELQIGHASVLHDLDASRTAREELAADLETVAAELAPRAILGEAIIGSGLGVKPDYPSGIPRKTAVRLTRVLERLEAVQPRPVDAIAALGGVPGTS